ncbi:MAG: cyclic lactone autoinducer peptide [Chitinophagales bacterium]
MRRAKTWILGSTIALLTLFAGVASASACFIFHYQPVVPQSLRK